jgi:hypothetical protein
VRVRARTCVCDTVTEPWGYVSIVFPSTFLSGIFAALLQVHTTPAHSTKMSYCQPEGKPECQFLWRMLDRNCLVVSDSARMSMLSRAFIASYLPLYDQIKQSSVIQFNSIQFNLIQFNSIFLIIVTLSPPRKQPKGQRLSLIVIGHWMAM